MKLLIRIIIVVQAFVFLFNGVIYCVLGDLEKWFSRWSLGITLLALYGIMLHLKKNKED